MAKEYECPLCKIRGRRSLKLYIVRGRDKLKLFKTDREKIITHWNLLNYRERRFMRLRYGICDGSGDNRNPHSLEEVAKIVGLTRQRIQQIQVAVLNKINKFK